MTPGVERQARGTGPGNGGEQGGGAGRRRWEWRNRAEPAAPTEGPAPAPAGRRRFTMRTWMGPKRRLRFHRSGWVFSVGAIFLGVAAIATGNNLLFLLLGAMLGFIALSGSLSELVLRKVAVRRRVPRGAVARQPARISYELQNLKRRLPSFAIEAGEADHPARTFIASVEAGHTAIARVELTWERRGVYPLRAVTLSTSFPFGLFHKELDVELPGEVVVWPRSDLPVREPRPAGQRSHRGAHAQSGAAGARGEYRGLRPYRPGDDPRDVHWRSTARLGDPVIREYERDRAQILWICLDLRAPADEEAEAAVEIAASLAADAFRRGEAFGLATADGRVNPGSGPGQLERVLDALARVRFRTDAPRTPSPAPHRECVLVTASGAAGAPWGDVFVANAPLAAEHNSRSAAPPGMGAGRGEGGQQAIEASQRRTSNSHFSAPV